jgi:urease accessory protein
VHIPAKIAVHPLFPERVPNLERGNGAVELGFGGTNGTTMLTHLYQHDPCRALFPRPAPGDPLTAILLTTSGGLTDGDRIRLSITLADGAMATVTSQAAEKFYRSRGAECVVEVALDVAAGAWLEWLPQEAILFDGARVARRNLCRVAAGGRLLACDLLVFGRLARGERFRRGLLHDRWQVHRAGRLAWLDSLRMEDAGIAAAFADKVGFDDAEALGTVFYVADDAARWVEFARELVVETNCRAGATMVNGVLLARFLGAAPAVRATMTGYIESMRHAVAGLPERLPRVWYH